MDVRLDDEGVTASGETFLRAFFYQRMAGADDLLIDAVEQLGSKEAQVVLERLQLVLSLVAPVAVTEHLAQRGVLVGQLVNAVVVGVEPEPQHAEHEDAPLLHARAAQAGIGLALASDPIRYDFPEDGEDSLAQRGLGVDVLQSAQDLRNVVTRFRVQLDGANVGGIERHLGVDHVAHGNLAR